MKRVLSFISVLIILSTSLVTITGYTLAKESDNVTFRIIDEWGDTGLLEGITAEMQFTHHNQLNWTVEFTPSGETKCKYDYNTFYNANRNAASYYGMSYPYIDIFDTKNALLQEIITNLKTEAKKPGDIKSRKIHFRELYEYYPVNFDLNLPEISISWASGVFDENGEYIFSGITPSKGQALLNKFNEYFRVPVNENDILELSVHAADNGTFSYRASHRKTFNFVFTNVLSSECIYFTFPNEINTGHEETRELVDTSEIRGGYGIYALPYTGKNIKYEELNTVYRIPGDATAESLSIDTERNELYLGLHENEKFILHIIDMNTMTDKTALELFDFNFHDNIRVEQGEDFFIFIKNDIDYNVVEITQDGTHESSLSGTIPPETIADKDFFSYNSWFGFNGKRLVVLTIENPGTEEIKLMTIQPDIMIFTKDGLSYYGKWICSLSDPVSNWGMSFVTLNGNCKINIK